MTFTVTLNHDGSESLIANTETLAQAITEAAYASGYNVRTVRDYVYGRKAGWSHPADAYIVPVKRHPVLGRGGPQDDHRAIWIEDTSK